MQKSEKPGIIHRKSYWKRYAIIYAIGLIIANAFAFYPAFAYHAAFGCPILRPVTYQIQGAAQVFGPPLFSQVQMVMSPGSTAYEMKIYNDDQNNLTAQFQNYPQSGTNPVTQYLYKLGNNGASLTGVAANETGVTITFQYKTFQGIHVAVLHYSIQVNSSATGASYEIGDAPCGTGLVLTVGNLPYTGPVWHGEVQLVQVIIYNIIAIVASTIACIGLRFYWTRRSLQATGSLGHTPCRELGK